jgi:hypothetical protein
MRQARAVTYPSMPRMRSAPNSPCPQTAHGNERRCTSIGPTAVKTVRDGPWSVRGALRRTPFFAPRQRLDFPAAKVERNRARPSRKASCSQTARPVPSAAVNAVCEGARHRRWPASAPAHHHDIQLSTSAWVILPKNLISSVDLRTNYRSQNREGPPHRKLRLVSCNQPV